ncbi:MAG: hypothetical protein A4E62_01897 [Syntrophorhabdus sp. PtaU1.Bin002]|nr:MAG: hypothetical protein A4E62_01897 [Syntrophorhabdus sp. PtaU1.Bin002]
MPVGIYVARDGNLTAAVDYECFLINRWFLQPHVGDP